MSAIAQDRPRASLRALKPLIPSGFRYKGRIAAAIGALALASAATLVLPVAARRVIDHGFSPEGRQLIDAYFAVLVAVSWDEPGGEESPVVAFAQQLALLAAAWVVHRLVSPVQRWLVRRASGRWKVGVVAPDPHRAPRGQWVLHDERLPAGTDPRERMDELVEDVRSGAFDAHRRVRGIRTSLR